MINKEQTQLTFPCTRWMQMTEGQLKRVKEIQCTEYESRILMLRDIFLVLAGLKIADNGADIINYFIQNSGEDEKSVYANIDTLRDFLNGDLIVLQKEDDASKVYFLPLDMFHAYIVAHTEFIDKDHSLIQLPFSDITIGTHEYKVPDGLLLNTTYQQYTNAQHYLEAYWNAMQQLEKIMEIQDEKQLMKMESSIKELISQSEDMQRGFIANMLTQYIKQGETRYDEQGQPYTFIRKVAKYVADDEPAIKEEMRHAPRWLFSLLYQQLQDNLKQFRSKFPDLFKESQADPKHDALVAELGTINIIIEKGGYSNAAAVYDENAVFIFKRLDMINEEARETKAAMSKNKR